jgi:hypothetical protein
LSSAESATNPRVPLFVVLPAVLNTDGSLSENLFLIGRASHSPPRRLAKAMMGLRPVFFVPRTPDFLSRLVALSNSMRLSLKKAAHAVLSDAA